MRHFALIGKEEGPDYGAEFPGFPGCITAGRDPDEAAAMAEEAPNFHLEGIEEGGEYIPEPSPPEN